MKPIFLLFLIGTIALGACSPVPPAGSGGTPVDNKEPAEATDSGSNPTPGDEPISPSDGDTATPSWDTDPEAVIISATFCCGFAPYFLTINYIPDAQVWGDGRIVWVEQMDDGSRKVMQGQLGKDDLAKLLAKIDAAGFYGWKDLYRNDTVADFADKCIQVDTLAEQKSVCEYFEGAPEAFHELYDVLSSGAGAEGVDYLPDTGFLTATSFGEDVQLGPGQVVATWDPAELGINLSEVGDGLWIEGDALKASWAAVNLQPWGPTVLEEATAYTIGLQIPGLSMTAPPDR
jgi:hypothetical protein